MRSLRKIKILGYPFAGGQGKCGVELTPSWLNSQKWFKDLESTSNGKISYEEIQVTDSHSNLKSDKDFDMKDDQSDDIQPRNIDNVLRSSMSLRAQTYNALKQGYYPIVLGGDHSQAIGSIAGLKSMYPEAKLLWVDAHIDANTPETSPSQNVHGMPLAYLSGMVPNQANWKCMNYQEDICYFGIRSYEPEELQLVHDKNILVFEASECQKQNLGAIERELTRYFKKRNNQYWISFDIDSVDAKSFGSTGTAEEDGLSLDFVENFFQQMASKTVGMDFTEVNFELAQSIEEKIKDQQTFKHLLELICHSVNSPTSIHDQTNMHIPSYIPSYEAHGYHENLFTKHAPSSRFFSVKNTKK